MNFRAALLLLLAALLGLSAVLLASHWVSTQEAGGPKVVVASADIALGQPISPVMVRLIDWPKGSVPNGAFSDIKSVEGRVLKEGIFRGEPVLSAKLAPIGTVGGLSAVIGAGKRAITVRVNDVIGVAGFALPGNYVDILVNTDKNSREAADLHRDQNISKIVLEKILVLAVAQEVGRDETKPKVVDAVTLEVSPDQAEKIDLARSIGKLSLVLRNQVDSQTADTSGATRDSLLQLPLPAPAIKPVTSRHEVKKARPVVVRPSSNCVRVLSGPDSRQECF